MKKNQYLLIYLRITILLSHNQNYSTLYSTCDDMINIQLYFFDIRKIFNSIIEI